MRADKNPISHKINYERVMVPVSDNIEAILNGRPVIVTEATPQQAKATKTGSFVWRPVGKEVRREKYVPTVMEPWDKGMMRLRQNPQ
jgi:hypothetical protein